MNAILPAACKTSSWILWRKTTSSQQAQNSGGALHGNRAESRITSRKSVAPAPKHNVSGSTYGRNTKSADILLVWNVVF